MIRAVTGAGNSTFSPGENLEFIASLRFYKLVHIDGGGGMPNACAAAGTGATPVVGREGNPDVRQTAGNVLVQPGEEPSSWVSRLSTSALLGASPVRTRGPPGRWQKG